MSEVIITSEMKEDAKKCGKDMVCDTCKMKKIHVGYVTNCVEALASLLGVWDGAPDDAVSAEVCFYKYRIFRGKEGLLEMKSYSRTLPKSLEDEIAEKCSHTYFKYGGNIPITESDITKVVKNALKEYNERQGGREMSYKFKLKLPGNGFGFPCNICSNNNQNVNDCKTCPGYSGAVTEYDFSKVIERLINEGK